MAWFEDSLRENYKYYGIAETKDGKFYFYTNNHRQFIKFLNGKDKIIDILGVKK